MLVTTQAALLGLLLQVCLTRAACVDYLSCSGDANAKNVNPCCVPTPGGLFVFRQRFEPDVEGDAGSWGVDGIDVLDCKSQPVVAPLASTRTHEEIASACLRSDMFGGERGYNVAEKVWAQREVGEGVEEIWERSWNTAGRYISTLVPKCYPGEPNGHEIAEYFHSLHKLHIRFPVDQLLADADITPSDDVTYSLKELIEALTFDGHRAIVTCEHAMLSSIWWPLQVKGNFQHGVFQPSTLYTQTSPCPSEGIIYPPSATRPSPTPIHTWDDLHRPTPRPITKSNDESRLYHAQEEEPNRQDPMKLGLFKMGDEERDEKKEEAMSRAFWRDEL